MKHPHPVDVHVGLRVRHRRWLLDMSQKELAKRVGVQFQQIQKYETGANRISSSALWDIAQALRVPVEYFFENYDPSGEKDFFVNIVSNKEGADLLRIYYGIPQKKRVVLRALAKALAADQ